MNYLRTTTLLFIFLCSIIQTNAQNDVSDELMKQGVWFLYATRIEEKTADNESVSQDEFFKKDDVSSMFFEKDKVYSVYSKIGNDVLEDGWKIVDDTHFVMVGPDDGSAQMMEILELSSERLVIKSCNEIDNLVSCTQFTYLSSKDKWPTDAEIDNMNAASMTDNTSE